MCSARASHGGLPKGEACYVLLVVSAKNLTTWLRTPAGLALLAGLLLVQAPAVAGAATSTKLGSVTLHRCAQPKVAWCGTLERPWNPAQPSLGSLSVAFKVFLPPVRSQGTIVAVEGGPGYPSTGSAPSTARCTGRCSRPTRCF